MLSTNSFVTTPSGYRQLLDWLSGFGSVEAIAVESTGSYAAGLVRYLRGHDVRVVEVNRPHAHTRRRVGKSDPIDAEMAARLFLAGKGKAIPKQTDGIVESIRILRTARNSAVKSRSAHQPDPRLLGQDHPHRLNYGGDRQANEALHLIAVCRLRFCPRTRAYAHRRAAEGKTKREILRCLKRYTAREVYNALRADLPKPTNSNRTPTPSPSPSPAASPAPAAPANALDIYRNVAGSPRFHPVTGSRGSH